MGPHGPLFDRFQTVPNGSENLRNQSEPISVDSANSAISQVPESGTKTEKTPTIMRFQSVPLSGERTERNRSLIPPVPTSSLAAAGSGAPQGDRGVGSGPDPAPPSAGQSALRAATDQAALSAGALTARPYQVSAIAAVESQFAAGTRRTLVVLPTGTGKTIVLALLLLRRKLAQEGRRARGLVLAHRTELIAQNAAKCRAAGLSTSIEQGDSHANRSSDVVVASVQTLQRSRLVTLASNEFDFIVVDEAHHVAAKGYQNILEHFPDALVLGLTASPMRLDGKPLGDTFESTAFSYELRTAIADGWLVPIVARRVRITDVDMSQVKAAHGDLAKEELGAVLRDAKALQGVVGPLISLGGSRRTLVFAVDVAHAHALAELLNKHKPGSALALDGTMPDAKRRAILELYRAGSFQYLVNCELLTEGFDDPGIECVALARPTMSVALLIQMVGRGTRLLGLTLAESIANGKRELLLLDFVGNLRHRLATPADALAGMKLPDDMAAEVAKDLDTGKELNVSLVLAEAEDRTAEETRRKAQLALAHYRIKEIDPFLGDQMPPLDPNSPAAKKPATDAQLAAIEKWNLGKPPAGLTMGEASAMLDAAAERNRLGLATIGQCRLLNKFKLDTRAMSKARATELFLKGKARGFSGEWIFRNEPEYCAGKKL